MLDSPPFEVSFGNFGRSVLFRLRLRSSPDDCQAGLTFEEVGWKGFVEVICEDTCQEGKPSLQFKICVGAGVRRQELKFPVWHDFAQEELCVLREAAWDFARAAGGMGKALAVTMEVLPSNSFPASTSCHEARLLDKPLPEVPTAADDGDDDTGDNHPSADGGPEIIVKNTFLDIDEAPGAGLCGLARTRTAPAKTTQWLVRAAPAAEPVAEVAGDVCDADLDEGEDPSFGAPFTLGHGSEWPVEPELPVESYLQSEPPPLKPQMLHRTFDVEAACMRLEWVVSARKLSSNDSHPHVSPAFDLSFGPACPRASFKMLIYPLVVNDKKGGASFKKAGGRGYVELACEETLPASVPEVRFRIGIGSGEKRSAARGPVAHNFAERAVSGLPKKQGLWDFHTAVDKASNTFVVCLEVLSGLPAGAATTATGTAGASLQSAATAPTRVPGQKRW